ncbi:MAG: molybdopterin molybdotransferase MoeA [Planctomycetaceae bacterium]
MLSVPEALAAILAEVRPFDPERVPLHESLGLVLAEDVAAAEDSPPWDKSLMDGFAVRAADVAAGRGEWRVLEEVTAGRVPSRPIGEGEATQIMTGAPLPDGADAVIPVERVEYDAPGATMRLADAATMSHASSVVGTAHPTKPSIVAGTNVIRRATVFATGDRLVTSGTLLRPQELGLLAEIGQARPLVRRRPRVAVLATGDELVPVDETPGPGRIRNSNETMLCAQLRRAGAEAVPLGIARDEPGHLRAKILAGLECDALILSGGVSAGTKDLVPGELARAGVRQVFHKVRLKPGAPLWFGVGEGVTSSAERPGRSQRPGRWAAGTSEEETRNSSLVTRHFSPLVFGLPGNPVSSFVCCELFVRTALRRLMGIEPAEPQPVSAALGQVHVARGDRPTYHPARLAAEETGWVVHPVRWHGSSDLRATLDANALAIIPAGDREWNAGERIDVLPLS